MKCGGHCAYCRGWFDHNRATELGTRVLAQLDPKITGYAKHPADVRTVGTVWWNSKESAFRILGLAKANHAQQAAEGRYHWGADHAEHGTIVGIPGGPPDTGRRVDPLEGHRNVLDLIKTRVAAAAVVDLLRGHHTYLGDQLIWNGEIVLSVRKHCWTDCKLRIRSCVSESAHSKL